MMIKTRKDMIRSSGIMMTSLRAMYLSKQDHLFIRSLERRGSSLRNTSLLFPDTILIPAPHSTERGGFEVVEFVAVRAQVKLLGGVDEWQVFRDQSLELSEHVHHFC